MKLLRKFWVKITIAIIISFIFAGGFTDIAYPLSGICTDRGCSGGVAYEDVFSHPKDLLDNKQNSLVRFSQTFATVSLVSIFILNIPVLLKKKKA